MMHPVILVEQSHGFITAAVQFPGNMLTGVETEGQAGTDRKCGILANVVVRCGVPHFHGAVLHGIEHLQAGHKLTSGKNANLKFIISHFGEALGKNLGGAVNRVETFRKTRGQTPLDRRLRLRNRRRRYRPCCHACRSLFQECTSFHRPLH